MQSKGTNLKQKRILLCSVLTVPYTSGSGINLFRFARTLLKFDVDVSVLTFNWNLKHIPFQKVEGVKIYRIPACTLKLLNAVLNLLFLPVLLVVVLRYDVFMVYGPFIPYYKVLVFMASLFKKRTIIQSVNLTMDDIRTLLTGFWLKKTVNKKFLNSVDVYHAITPEFAHRYEEMNPEKKDRIFLSSQGVDLSRFYPVCEHDKVILKSKLGLPLDKPIIITIGNLINRKDFLL